MAATVLLGNASWKRTTQRALVPRQAEASWSPPEGEFAVWRGRLTAAWYRFAEADVPAVVL